MSEMILKFDVIEERHEAICAMRGSDLARVIFEFDQKLWSLIKHDESLSPELKEGLHKAHEILHEKICDHNLTFIWDS